MAIASIKEFNDTIKLLNDKFKSRSTYSIWIKLELIRDGKSIVFSSNNNENNYLISVSNIKYGLSFGTADSIEISLCYVPDPLSANGNYDISFIDRALASIGKGANDLCKFNLSYGYDFIDSKLHTIDYQGIISQYSVSINNGMLNYNLKATVTACNALDTKFDFEAVKNARRTDVAKNALSEKLEKLDYEVVFDVGVQGSDVIEEDIPGVSDVTVFAYATQLLKEAVNVNQVNDTDITDKITYTYTVDNKKNSNGKSTITICKNDPTTSQQDSVLVFNWMAKGDNLVISFDTTFDASVLLTALYAGSNKEFATLDSSGNMVYVKGIPQKAVGGGDTAKNDANADISSWADVVSNISNTAQLEMIGIPCEIPPATVIKIVPLIYGVPHYSAGFYQIQKVTDKISASGFVTSIELSRTDMVYNKKNLREINLSNS